MDDKRINEIIDFLKEREVWLKHQKRFSDAEKYNRIKTKILQNEPVHEKEYQLFANFLGISEKDLKNIADEYYSLIMEDYCIMMREIEENKYDCFPF